MHGRPPKQRQRRRPPWQRLWRGGLRLGGGRLGLGSIVIALVASYFLGVNPLTVLQLLSGGGMPCRAKRRRPTGRRPTTRHGPVRLQGLASTETPGTQAFQANGRQYQEPKLVLFSGMTPTACGTGQSAMGPTARATRRFISTSASSTT